MLLILFDWLCLQTYGLFTLGKLESGLSMVLAENLFVNTNITGEEVRLSSLNYRSPVKPRGWGRKAEKQKF